MTSLDIESKEHVQSRIDDLFTEIDKRIFSLSTGTLALSITFRSSLIPEEPTALWLLGISWSAFIISIVVSIIGYLLKAGVWAEMLTNDHFLLTRKYKAFIVIPRFMVMFSFVIGIVAFALFALANLS